MSKKETLDEERWILHEGYKDFLQWKKQGNSQGFYYFLSNVWQGVDHLLPENDRKKLGKNETQPISSPQDKKLRILLIEDEELKLSMMDLAIQKVLRENSIQATITYARNGRSGFSALEKNSFDIVFSDYRMPVMNGGEVFEKVSSWELVYKLQWIWTCSDHSTIQESLVNSYPHITVRHIKPPFTVNTLQKTILDSVQCIVG